MAFHILTTYNDLNDGFYTRIFDDSKMVAFIVTYNDDTQSPMTLISSGRKLQYIEDCLERDNRDYIRHDSYDYYLSENDIYKVISNHTDKLQKSKSHFAKNMANRIMCNINIGNPKSIENMIQNDYLANSWLLNLGLIG